MTFAEIADTLSPQEQIAVIGRFTDWAIHETTAIQRRIAQMGLPL